MDVAKLNEYAQRERLELRYEDIGSVGPDHIKTFTLRAVVNGKAYPDGVGKNKKEAKQNAAKNALRGLLEEPVTSTENAAETPTAPVHQTSIIQPNYICWLNEYGQKTRVNIRAVESTRLGPNSAILCCSFIVGDKEYPAATGKTKREAKEEAAKLVYHEICGSRTTETGEEKDSGISSQQEEKLVQNVSEICDKTKNLSVISEDEGCTGTNFIGIINHYCHKTKLLHDYKLEKKCGPPHSPQFFYKLVINNKDYPVAEGKSIKEAKQNAAQLAWAVLQEQSDWDSKVSVRSVVSADSTPARLCTPTSIRESRPAKPKSVPVITSDSAVVHSPGPPKDQIQSPDVKPKIRIAANFLNAKRNSKEDIMPNFNGKNPVISPSKKRTTQSATSRFTSEFDSITCLGKGAFGCVFKAKQILLKKFYAIKIVRCKDIKKALREVMALSDLHHCNIVRYYTCWLQSSGYQWDSTDETGSTSQSTGHSSVKYLYIQMELCDTRTLRVWIDEKNMQNVKKSLRDSKRREESLTIAYQIVNAVEYFHSKMLIHRDLKPANIMFGLDGEVKIGDFGLVTDENDDDAENLVERTVYKGTPSYMAPEQRSRSTYDRKVDVFALGLIYFELLWNLPTGPERKLFWDDVRNRNFPQGFTHNFPLEYKIIKSMLCAKPEDRPEATKLKVDLEEFTRTLIMLKEAQRNSKTSVMETGTYVAELYKYAHKTRSRLHYEDLGYVGPCHDRTFTQRAVLNGKAYPEGVGKNKKEAKNNAAKNVMKFLERKKTQDLVDTDAVEKDSCASGQQREDINQDVSNICTKIRSLSANSQLNRNQRTQREEAKFTGLIAHYCQRTNRCHSYIEERRCGPPHDPQFFYKLMIKSSEIITYYPEGQGKTVKEAKQDAARLAWDALQKQSDFDSKVSVRATMSEDSAQSVSLSPSTAGVSQEASSQSMSIFPSKAQVPLRSAASEDDAPAKLSTPTSLESLASSQSMSTGTSGSGKFTDSSNSSSDQRDVKKKNMGNNQNEAQSRFTSDFEPMECLGSGAFGCVYKVRHKLLEKFYAVKIVRRGEKSLREVGTLSDLLHCNIVRYYTFWMEDSGYQWNISSDSNSSSQSTDKSSAKYLYIQMELCDTKTLKKWIDEKNTETVPDPKRREESLSIAQQIVSGVVYIHSKKHIHRDLKPDNILFGVDREVKIGDFGLVTRDDNDDDDDLMERTGNEGTTSYMAPEQKREKTYDRKVDIFAMGLIYFELLWKLSTGHERVVVWEDARSQKFPEEFSQTFPQEDEIIKSMVHDKPEERPEANQLKAELEKWAQEFNAQNMHEKNATV
ncbi:interferon-induced, double-stranded RNA-activated protein kinase [Centropristis striata]|uniref:interferon-induced, double-stranded RNA-activated protein kinase n=1 Tax=Centropristis striata TaxID=184440 RepID=UPI0027E20909|nr:interferon-induced, double-stranded RNA-activated protein kinase [Centropristis striata]